METEPKIREPRWVYGETAFKIEVEYGSTLTVWHIVVRHSLDSKYVKELRCTTRHSEEYRRLKKSAKKKIKKALIEMFE